jgi:tetratricopeptide (TPR) repeat protein
MKLRLAGLVLSAGVLAAQTTTPGQTTTPAQPTTPAQTPAPATSSQAAEQQPAADSQLTRKTLTAKTQDEFEAYQKVVSQPNLALAETMAQDFAVRYPASDLRAPLFQSLMLKHQKANQADLTLTDAERVLLIDPQNVIALVTAANVLSERTLPGKPESARRFDQAVRYAQRAIDNIDTGLTVAPQASAEDAAGFRNTVLAIAHAAQGNVYLLQNDSAAAERHFSAAAELSPMPNALVLYRLAVTQHQQRRYDAALDNASKSFEVASANHDLIIMDRAKEEKNALVKALAKPQ